MDLNGMRSKYAKRKTTDENRTRGF